MPFLLFLNISVTVLTYNYKPSNLYSSFYTQQNVTKHPFP